MTPLRDEIRAVLNQYSAEQASNTPDFILADYLIDCLDAFDRAVTARSRWFGDEREPGR